MRIYKILIIGFLFTLIGCNSTKIHPDDNSWKVIRVANIELKYPAELTERPSADDHRIIDNDNDRNDLDHPQEYRIEITPQIETCSTSTLQELDSHTRPILELKETANPSNDILTIRGVQRPTGPEVEMSEENLKEWWSYQDTRYLFCSEHAGKSVVIVIAQKTDDPKLANDIFDSFRWTK